MTTFQLNLNEMAVNFEFEADQLLTMRFGDPKELIISESDIYPLTT